MPIHANAKAAISDKRRGVAAEGGQDNYEEPNPD